MITIKAMAAVFRCPLNTPFGNAVTPHKHSISYNCVREILNHFYLLSGFLKLFPSLPLRVIYSRCTELATHYFIFFFFILLGRTVHSAYIYK